MIKKIYIDMDGVLADFEKGITKVMPMFGKNTASLDNIDMWKYVNKNKAFWETLKPLSNCFKLIKLIEDKFPKATKNILTAIPNDEKKFKTLILSPSKDGKSKWISKYLPQFKNKIIFCLRKEKQNYSEIDSLLIDDNKTTIKEWNEKGGIGILYSNSNYNSIKKQLIEL
jgi:5'(3')-deoxyribonucleotidase